MSRRPPQPARPAAVATTRPTLHPRNRHAGRYDFVRLVQASPALSTHLLKTPRGDTSIDFSQPAAVRALNRAILAADYGIAHWDLPEGALCPPIPGRADYLHGLADLLAEDHDGRIPRGTAVRVLDVGVGANCIYPLLGHAEYGWRFVGSDIQPTSLQVAAAIVQANGLGKAIELRRQAQAAHIFQGVIGAGDRFAATLCNPPFHASPEAARAGTRRKWRNLGKGDHDALNFGGQRGELWCPGGEVGFIARMIAQSREVAEQCLWFTCLVSKQDNIAPLTRLLRRAEVAETRVVEMAQGQKTSRFIAWTYYPRRQRSL